MINTITNQVFSQRDESTLICKSLFAKYMDILLSSYWRASLKVIMLIGIAWNNVQPTSTARRSHSTCYGRSGSENRNQGTYDDI
ncbi:hypothetical protein Plhal304r1_c042g0121761 [Plasmopara halstedii]